MPMLPPISAYNAFETDATAAAAADPSDDESLGASAASPMAVDASTQGADDLKELTDNDDDDDDEFPTSISKSAPKEAKSKSSTTQASSAGRKRKIVESKSNSNLKSTTVVTASKKALAETSPGKPSKKKKKVEDQFSTVAVAEENTKQKELDVAKLKCKAETEKLSAKKEVKLAEIAALHEEKKHKAKMAELRAMQHHERKMAKLRQMQSYPPLQPASSQPYAQQRAFTSQANLGNPSHHYGGGNPSMYAPNSEHSQLQAGGSGTTRMSVSHSPSPGPSMGGAIYNETRLSSPAVDSLSSDSFEPSGMPSFVYGNANSTLDMFH